MVDELLPEGDDANRTPTGTEARELLEHSIEVVPVSPDLLSEGVNLL